MATQLSQFLSLLLPHLPGAPDVACMNALRRSAIEFAIRSMVWRASSMTDMVADQATYAIPAVTDAAVSQVLAVGVNGVWLEPKQIDDLARRQNWNTIAAALPTNYYTQTPGTVSLYPIPTTTISPGGLNFQTALQPLQDATTVPDFFYTYYAQTLVDGALALLMSTPAKDYTQPDLAVWHRQQFETGIAQATQQAANSFGRTPVRVTAVK